MDPTDRTLDGRRDAAIAAAAAAIEERLRLYGNDPATGSVGWGASPRELAALAYDAIITAAGQHMGAPLTTQLPTTTVRGQRITLDLGPWDE